jgi:phosphatidylglycerol---prolipoprotein diacylglyceryl transferase
MRGQLFTLLDIPFPSYFVLLLSGFIFATALGALWAKRIGQDPDVIVDLGLAMLIAGVAGARLLHVFADGKFWDYVNLCLDPAKVEWKITEQECRTPYEGIWDAARAVCHPDPKPGLGDAAGRCFAWAMFWQGGLAYYGGFVAASLTAWYVLKRDRFPFWKAADMAGMVLPIGLGFGRMGCLLGGCCFGRVSHVPWALVFPPHSASSQGQFERGLLSSPALPSLPVHPAQIYESLGSLLLSLGLVLWVHGRKRYDGQVFLAFVVGYAILRFLLEFWRDDDRGGFWGLSTSQLIGLALLVLAAAAHRRLTARAFVPPETRPALG